MIAGVSKPITRVILHIGLHKTGTSAIQAYLHSNSAVLLEQGNILYPEAGRKEEAMIRENHFSLAWSVVEKYARKYDVDISSDHWVALRDELKRKRPRIAIISSEFFWPANEEEIDVIRQYLVDFPAQVVLYLRNYRSLALSGYKQGVKTGKIYKNIDLHIRERLWNFDYDAIVQRWARVFDRSNVKVRIYDKVKGHILNDFAEAAGFDLPPGNKDSTYAKNVSPADGVIRLIRLLNMLEGRLPESQHDLIRRIRQNIVKGRQPGIVAARLANLILHGPILKEETEDWLRQATLDARERFLNNHVPSEDQHFFDF